MDLEHFKVSSDLVFLSAPFIGHRQNSGFGGPWVSAVSALSFFIQVKKNSIFFFAEVDFKLSLTIALHEAYGLNLKKKKNI